MKQAVLLAAFFLLCAVNAKAQMQIPMFASDPATCDSSRGLMYYNTTSNQVKLCIANNVYAPLSATVSSVDITTPITLTSASNEFRANENPTAAQAVVYNLPPTIVNAQQKCISNANSAGVANTGTVQIVASAGKFIVFTDGTNSASGGNVISGGAAGDAACVVGIDATHWLFYLQRGTWTKN